MSITMQSTSGGPQCCCFCCCLFLLPAVMLLILVVMLALLLMMRLLLLDGDSTGLDRTPAELQSLPLFNYNYSRFVIYIWCLRTKR